MRIALIHLAALLLGFVLGCATPNTLPSVSSVALNDDIAYAAPLWEREAARQYPRALVFVCHGKQRFGEWLCFPDEGPPMPVEAVARMLRKMYPDRQIVLVCCNESGFEFARPIPGVVYARDDVRCFPDSALPFRFPVGGVGSIEDLRP